MAVQKEQKVGQIGEMLFETNDLGLAAFLQMKGMQIKAMTKQRGRTVFAFLDKPERKGLVNIYFNGEATISPLAFRNALRDLKVFTINH